MITSFFYAAGGRECLAPQLVGVVERVGPVPAAVSLVEPEQDAVLYLWRRRAVRGPGRPDPERAPGERRRGPDGSRLDGHLQPLRDRAAQALTDLVAPHL